MVLWRKLAEPCLSPDGIDAWKAFSSTQTSFGRTAGFVSQPAHAHLAGEIAAALLRDVFGELGAEALAAIREHDQGWAEPDLEALQMADGTEPESFVAVAPEPAIGAWRRSIRQAEQRGALAGAMTSRHFCLLAPSDTAHAGFVAEETARRVQLERAADLDAAQLIRTTAALGFVDMLSLLLCAGYRGRVSLPLAHPADKAARKQAEEVTLELDSDAVRCSRPLFHDGSRVAVWRWRRGQRAGELLADRSAWTLAQGSGRALSAPVPDPVADHSRADETWMRLALEQARLGEQTPGGAQVGAVIVRDGAVLCRGFNEGEGRHDPTAHAEMVVIRRLCAALETTSLRGCTVFCTLQPCGMCTMACLWAGVSRIVFGAGRGDVHAVYFESRHRDTTSFIADAFRSDLEVTGGVLAEECAAFYAKPNDAVDQAADPAHGPTVRPD